MKNTDRLLPLLFVFIWTLALVHVVAEYQYWYWIYRWLDIPMHFFGGMWVGLAGLWLWRAYPALQRYVRINLSPFAIAIGAGVVVGLLWEVYEYGVWQFSGNGLPLNYYGDSSLDLIMDILGAWCAYLAYRCIFRTSPGVDAEV